MNRFSVALVVGAVALVAGCGDASPKEFVKQVDEAAAPLNSMSLDAKSGPEDFDKAAGALDQVADRLRDLKPPGDSEDELAALTKEIEGGADDFRQAGSALASGDKDTLDESANALDGRMKAIADKLQKLQTSIND